MIMIITSIKTLLGYHSFLLLRPDSFFRVQKKVCRYELETDAASYERERKERMKERKPRYSTSDSSHSESFDFLEVI